MQKEILIVEDEVAIVDILSYNLTREGYKPTAAFDGLEGLSLALSGDFDLILLDVMLPGMDGFDICKKVREKSDIPILMLTAREEEIDKVLGLELGADDYITKPFSMRELMARVKANLRRREGDLRSEGKEEQGEGAAFTVGDLRIDPQRFEARRGERLLELSLREFELLRFLAKNPDHVFTREAILEQVWGYEHYGDVRTIDVTVRRLREKIERDPTVPQNIMTKRGVGYYFTADGK